MLSRIVRLRRQLSAAGVKGGEPVYPLKLIIMSATLRLAVTSVSHELSLKLDKTLQDCQKFPK